MKSSDLFSLDFHMPDYLRGVRGSASLICTYNPCVYCTVLTFLGYYISNHVSLHLHIGCFQRPHKKMGFSAPPVICCMLS
jgi:hypothetical protein